MVITCLGLAKDFDSLDKLNQICTLNEPNLGFKSRALDWFVSYFDCRQQMVSDIGMEISRVNVNYGLVQGSTLRQLLFLNYINNIVKV